MDEENVDEQLDTGKANCYVGGESEELSRDTLTQAWNVTISFCRTGETLHQKSCGIGVSQMHIQPSVNKLHQIVVNQE